MAITPEFTGVSTLIGTPKDVQIELEHFHADQVLVLGLDQVNDQALNTLTENLRNIATSMFIILQDRQDSAAIERLADALVPSKPVAPKLLKEAAMLAQARKAVLESGDWLTATEVAQLAGLSIRNPSAQPNKWKKQGKIFAIHHGGVDYFPSYGLSPEKNFRPVEELASVIDVFSGRKDAWGMAYWFRSVNSYLGGLCPQDLLATAPNRVLEAALDEIEGIVHG